MNDLVIALEDIRESVVTVKNKVEENNIIAMEILKLIREINRG